ncbi:mitochondrial peptide methionine sulfoxide reductase-like protein [Lates japonicus]|uniref:peptide-methionine (S)-S-oxide reductase n=1 Tax=Lates japonicus TaxID=270547 RepID=A0AAD3RMI7_LATJO|nr:mitochondrial peptide methionine sulfoxide reductase-like protein [Lates japonicus]
MEGSDDNMKGSRRKMKETRQSERGRQRGGGGEGLSNFPQPDISCSVHLSLSGLESREEKGSSPSAQTVAVTLAVGSKHDVNGNKTVPPFPEGTEMAMFGMGCFWGAERKFWRQKGVYSTQVGYSGGYTPNPTYKEICTGKTGHTEVVRVVFHPDQISFSNLLKVFWESHNPTQGMRQGNDIGTTYRSAIYTYTKQQLEEALASKDQYQKHPSLL